MLTAGIVMGSMIIPYVSSLSEDAMRAVPMLVRDASYALGVTKWQTVWPHFLPDTTGGIATGVIIAMPRALAINSEILLRDEPTSALDPMATTRIEELIQSITDRATIIIVTHSMQHAARVSDYTGLLGHDRMVV
jgi:ABC-type transporter Mla maintaining outer membrane lipid asymmetry ATPase subunit MlaF